MAGKEEHLTVTFRGVHGTVLSTIEARAIVFTEWHLESLRIISVLLDLDNASERKEINRKGAGKYAAFCL